MFLDFYRYGKVNEIESVLSHIDSNHDKIITSSQVEMEFKKNRQKVVLEELEKELKKELKDESDSQKKNKNTAKKIKKQLNNIEKKIEKKFENKLFKPKLYDPVYKATQRLFKNETQYNLTRKKEERFNIIRDLANKRFKLGYPPRKNKDTSIGDALNWEWIIHCAKEDKKNIIIVTRDSDYGELYKGEPILNEWLFQEFNERVRKKRKIEIKRSLMEAFKSVDIPVNDKEIKAEEKVFSNLDSVDKSYGYISPTWLFESLHSLRKGSVEK